MQLPCSAKQQHAAPTWPEALHILINVHLHFALCRHAAHPPRSLAQRRKGGLQVGTHLVARLQAGRQTGRQGAMSSNSRSSTAESAMRVGGCLQVASSHRHAARQQQQQRMSPGGGGQQATSSWECSPCPPRTFPSTRSRRSARTAAQSCRVIVAGRQRQGQGTAVGGLQQANCSCSCCLRGISLQARRQRSPADRVQATSLTHPMSVNRPAKTISVSTSSSPVLSSLANRPCSTAQYRKAGVSCVCVRGGCLGVGGAGSGAQAVSFAEAQR